MAPIALSATSFLSSRVKISLFRPSICSVSVLKAPAHSFASSGCVAASAFDPRIGLPTLVAALWLPALRRALLRRGAMPIRQLLAGLAASPPFDLAFLVQYLRGLLGAR